MHASIKRGRIHVHLDPGMDPVRRQEVQEHLAGSIGSARFVDKQPDVVSCALSVENFRKLRAMGCGLAKDRHTKDIVQNLREQLDEYEDDTRRAADAKDGHTVYQGYDFKLPPFEHQRLGFQFLHSLKTPALFGDCGSGKTFMVLTFADSLLKAGEEWAFIVVCPVNLIKHVWIDDAAKFSDLHVVGLREQTITRVLASDFDDKKDPEISRKDRSALRSERRADSSWKAKAKRKAAARYRKVLKARFEQAADMYVINPEGIRTDPKEKLVRDLCKRLKKEGKEICLIVDESSKVKSRTSRTYRAIKRIRTLCSRCIIMTGTPSPNGILDLWAQFSILDGGMTLQPSFVDFRRDTCTEIVLKGVTWEKDGKTYNATKWHPKASAPMDVHRTISPRMIRFKLEDCIDLPPTRFIIREVEMSSDQDAFYRDMEERLFAELEGEPVTAKVAVTKLVKLREVTGGFVRTDEGEDIPFNKDAPKMLELDELLRQSIGNKLGDDGPPVKALVWAQYRWECKTLVARYQNEYGARGLFGGISSGAKDLAIKNFHEHPGCRLLVCHPMSAGHGLTLTEASYSFYYSMSHNFEEFYQSFRRITRPGQTRPTTFYFLVSPGTIDEELIDAIRAKKNLSDLVTDGRFGRDEFLEAREKAKGSQVDFSWDLPATDQNETL